MCIVFESESLGYEEVERVMLGGYPRLLGPITKMHIKSHSTTLLLVLFFTVNSDTFCEDQRRAW
jgi:hypothetical protein